MPRVNDHIAIARPDHWFKNITLVPGIWLALWVLKPALAPHLFISMGLAFLATFMVSCGNYTLNELVDAIDDKNHPQRKERPAACGRIEPGAGYAQWIILSVLGFGLGWFVNKPFLMTEMVFFVLAIIYNVKPWRTKDTAYVDVLSESLNNPVRFLLGWLAVGYSVWPSLLLLLAFWMLGAFFMSIKRLAELRYLGDPAAAARFRKSFSQYTEQNLFLEAVFYAALFGNFVGMFAANYWPSLVLALPFVAGFLGLYMREGLKPDSLARTPEKIYRRPLLMGYLAVLMAIMAACLAIHLPWIK